MHFHKEMVLPRVAVFVNDRVTVLLVHTCASMPIHIVGFGVVLLDYLRPIPFTYTIQVWCKETVT